MSPAFDSDSDSMSGDIKTFMFPAGDDYDLINFVQINSGSNDWVRGIRFLSNDSPLTVLADVTGAEYELCTDECGARPKDWRAP